MKENIRILIVDDNPDIHHDFKSILCNAEQAPEHEALGDLEADLFGETPQASIRLSYDLSFASQGQEALVKVEQALAENRPFAMTFVDVRMPPGWDGVETIRRMWTQEPELQVVICTAFSDYSWDDLVDQLGVSDRLLFLRKPFDVTEVKQLALTLTRVWNQHRDMEEEMNILKHKVEARSLALKKLFAEQAAERASS